jgi:hypothetical protein
MEFVFVSEMADCIQMGKYCNVKFPVTGYYFNDTHIKKKKQVNIIRDPTAYDSLFHSFAIGD